MSKNIVTLSLSRFKELENKESVLNKLLEDSKKLTVIESGFFVDCSKILYLSTESEEIEKLISKLEARNAERVHWEEKYNGLKNQSFLRKIFNHE